MAQVLGADYSTLRGWAWRPKSSSSFNINSPVHVLVVQKCRFGVVRFGLGYLWKLAKASTLLVIRWHLVVNVADQRYPHLSGVVASKDITDEMCLNLHVNLYLR